MDDKAIIADTFQTTTTQYDKVMGLWRLNEILSNQKVLLAKLNLLLQNQGIEMATLDDVVSADATLQNEVAAILGFVKTEEQAIIDLQAQLANVTLTPDQQAKVDKLFADLTAANNNIQAALP